MSDLDLGATIKGLAPNQRVFRRYRLVRPLGHGVELARTGWLAMAQEIEVKAGERGDFSRAFPSGKVHLSTDPTAAKFSIGGGLTQTRRPLSQAKRFLACRCCRFCYSEIRPLP